LSSYPKHRYIETTVNDISFFKHYREVLQRDGRTSKQVASVKKSIYSLPALSEILKAANKSSLDYISAFDNKEVARNRLRKVTGDTIVNNRNFKSFNLFNQERPLNIIDIAQRRI
jgi:hypothetical protein